MLVTNISEFDAGEYIESDEDAIAYFNAMAETGDSTLLQASLDDISKARGVIQIAAGEAGEPNRAAKTGGDMSVSSFRRHSLSSSRSSACAPSARARLAAVFRLMLAVE